MDKAWIWERHKAMDELLTKWWEKTIEEGDEALQKLREGKGGRRREGSEGNNRRGCVG